MSCHPVGRFNAPALTNGIPPIPRRPSRRKQKKRSRNCGANIRVLVSSTGKREGRKFGRHWCLSKRFLLELLPMRSRGNAPITAIIARKKPLPVASPPRGHYPTGPLEITHGHEARRISANPLQGSTRRRQRQRRRRGLADRSSGRLRRP